MIKTLLNPNHVLTDCDNIENLDAQRMATVLGKHLYGFKKGDERTIVKTLGLDANDDVCWSTSGVPGGGLPPSTPEDEGKILAVDENGDPEWTSLVDAAAPFAIANGSVVFTPGQYYTDGSVTLSDIRSNYVEYAYNHDGWVLEKDHVYVIAYNIVATTTGPSNDYIGGRIWLDGYQETDQVWKFVLDSSYVHDESLTGSAIVCPQNDGEVHLNIRFDDNNLSHVPTAYVNKAEIVDVTARISGGGGGGGPQYRPGPGIEIDDDVISIDPAEAQEKLTAGANIDITDNVISTEKAVVAAGSNVTVTSSTDSETKVTTYTVSASGSGVQPVQSNWAESDSQSLAYIQNKPQNLVQDADYTHTDNNFTDADKTKLDNIESGAEANVQSNWAETDTDSDAYIQNKPNLAAVATSGSYNDLADQPTIPSGTQLLPPATPADENKVLSVDENGYPDWVTPGSAQQVQSDWTESDNTEPSYIQHKPSVKNLIAGTGISITETAQGIVISLA